MATKSEYKILELIGKGTFGKIFKAQKNGSEKLVALKEVDWSKCCKKDKEHVLKEVELLHTCHHKNVVQFKEAFSTEKCINIIMQLCNRGNLRKYIDENNGLSEEDCVLVLKQICCGLEYLHDLNIVHRDLKTTNIYMHEENGELCVKIGDFGLAKVMDAQLTACVGSPYFMSPEMINGQEYDKSTDIWSLGCCAYEMATTDVPYQAKDMPGLKERIAKHIVEVGKIPYCRDVQNLIMDMMNKDKTQRPRVQDVLEFLSQHNHAQKTAGMTSQHNRTQKTTGSKGRRKTGSFASTWSSGSMPQTVSGTGTISNKRLGDTSGYDSHEEQSPREEPVIVSAKVIMTEAEKNCMEKSERLQQDILKVIRDANVIDKIIHAIDRTKHMDNYNIFMAEMEKILDKKSYERCKCDLGALWMYKKEILKKRFKIAWS